VHLKQQSLGAEQ